ncbi:MAG: diguanylate cyclase [Lachnospiraceae bacterium]|nr:diguanylate cyclase [Lachnospiraceae bacterium]
MKIIINEFDGVNEIVYVADMDDYTLLYLNKAGLKLLGYTRREQILGKKCYEVLQGQQQPCETCTNGKLCRGKFLEWKYDNPITGNKCKLKDKLILWNGKEVHFTIADFSLINGDGTFNRKTEREKIVMECIQMMHSSVKTDVAINNTLEILGKYLNGERTYIFRVHGKLMNNEYEWCAEGISREIDFLQNVPLSTIRRWLPYFYCNESVIIPDLEMIKEVALDEYSILKHQNINSLIAVPLIEKGKLIGYFGVDNPKARNLDEISNILKMLSYFFESLLERKDRESYLERIGFTDALTGALNRNAFIRDTMPESDSDIVSAGGFFIDINGLKKTNDTYGHEAGDNLIRKVYDIISSVAEGYPIYRLGGDEFAVLCCNISQKELDKIDIRMRTELDGRNGCSAAIGASFLENPSDLGILMDEADKRMYKDKKQYYKKIR